MMKVAECAILVHPGITMNKLISVVENRIIVLSLTPELRNVRFVTQTFISMKMSLIV